MDLEQYIGKLGTMVVDSSVRFAANYMYQVFSMEPEDNVVGWDQKKFEDKPAPSVDSETDHTGSFRKFVLFDADNQDGKF